MSDEVKNNEIEEPEAEQATPELTTEEQLEKVSAERDELFDKYARTLAEFQNARKRMEKARINAYTNATVDLAAKLLPVIDDIALALNNVPAEIADNDWVEGIGMVRRKLDGILEKIRLKPIEAVGQLFDPNLHDAVMQEESEEFESGIVSKELQTGYQINERVIRPSLVIVAA